MSRLTTVSLSDYPASFVGADQASVDAQSTHLRLQKTYLASLVAAALVSLLTSFTALQADRWFYGLSALVLVVGLVLLWIQRALRYDKTWFECRAAAESIKTITWRLMMAVPPFGADKDRPDVDAVFVQRLSEILRSRSSIQKQCSLRAPTGGLEISETMHAIRSLPLSERIYIYVSQRLADQESWYSEKTAFHANVASRFFWLIVSLQVMAVVAALIHLVADYLAFWSVPLITTVAAALIAWSQTRRHDELSVAYSMAAQELRALRSVATNVDTQGHFEELVEQVEDAISREHTMWCARREIKLPPAKAPVCEADGHVR